MPNFSSVLIALCVALLSSTALAVAQSDNLNDEQYCTVNSPNVATATLLNARMIGDACFHAAEVRFKKGKLPGTSRAQQSDLMYAAAFYVDAGKARYRAGMMNTAGQELDFADEALSIVLAHPASQDLRRTAATFHDYIHSLRTSLR